MLSVLTRPLAAHGLGGLTVASGFLLGALLPPGAGLAAVQGFLWLTLALMAGGSAGVLMFSVSLGPDPFLDNLRMTGHLANLRGNLKRGGALALAASMPLLASHEVGASLVPIWVCVASALLIPALGECAQGLAKWAKILRLMRSPKPGHQSRVARRITSGV